MEQEGFIQYYQIVPNLGLFGQPLACLCNFQASDVVAKHRDLEWLRKADDVIDIADYLGEGFGVTLSASSKQDSESKAQAISKQIRADHFVVLPPRSFSKVEDFLDRLDWQIIKSLRYDALRHVDDVAKEVGVTHRMADYRIKKLFDSRALSTRAIINA